MSATVDTAVINALRNDATLTTLAPGGVYRDSAPEGVVDAALNDADEVFGVVTLLSAVTDYVYEGVGKEECLYLVKFVTPSTSPVTAQSALDRAETVLGGLVGRSAVSGYAVSKSRREERVAYVQDDGPVRWQHRGVHWAVTASPTS